MIIGLKLHAQDTLDVQVPEYNILIIRFLFNLCEAYSDDFMVRILILNALAVDQLQGTFLGINLVSDKDATVTFYIFVFRVFYNLLNSIINQVVNTG